MLSFLFRSLVLLSVLMPTMALGSHALEQKADEKFLDEKGPETPKEVYDRFAAIYSGKTAKATPKGDAAMNGNMTGKCAEVTYAEVKDGKVVRLANPRYDILPSALMVLYKSVGVNKAPAIGMLVANKEGAFPATSYKEHRKTLLDQHSVPIPKNNSDVLGILDNNSPVANDPDDNRSALSYRRNLIRAGSRSGPFRNVNYYLRNFTNEAGRTETVVRSVETYTPLMQYDRPAIVLRSTFCL